MGVRWFVHCVIGVAVASLVLGAGAQQRGKQSGRKPPSSGKPAQTKQTPPPADPFDLNAPYDTSNAIQLDPEKDLPVSSWVQPKIAKATASYFRPENPLPPECQRSLEDRGLDAWGDRA